MTESEALAALRAMVAKNKVCRGLTCDCDRVWPDARRRAFPTARRSQSRSSAWDTVEP